MDIIKNVDFLELVNIIVFRGEPTPADPCPIQIQFEPLDEKKNVVFDEDALRTLNARVTERIRDMQLKWNDPNARSYLQEYVGRLAAELHRNGLVEIVDAHSAPSDPYADLRNLPDKMN